MGTHHAHQLLGGAQRRQACSDGGVLTQVTGWRPDGASSLGPAHMDCGFQCLAGETKVRPGLLRSSLHLIALPSLRSPSSRVCVCNSSAGCWPSRRGGSSSSPCLCGGVKWTLYSSVLPAWQVLTRVTCGAAKQLLGLTLVAHKAIPGPSISWT